MYKRILVPVDGSHTSTLGLQEAIRLAKASSGQLRLLNVVDEMVVTQNFDGYVNPGDLIDTLKDSGKKTIAKGVALATKNGVPVESALYETMGKRLAEIVVREAKKWKADLIVMGTHGRRGFNRMVLGSDAETVLRTAPVPVLMVRSKSK